MPCTDRPRLAYASVVAVALLAAGPAFAAERPVIVVVASGGLDAARVREAIGRELDVTAVGDGDARASGAPRITIDASSKDRTLTVAFRKRDAPEVLRVVALPEGPNRAEAAAVILASNVARDQASEIVASLHKRVSPPAAREPEAPAHEPEPRGGAPQAGEPAEPTYTVRLADLERRVAELKSRVAPPAEARKVWYRVRLNSATSDTFVLQRARISADGVVVHDGPIHSGDFVDVFGTPNAAHEISVAVRYRGRDAVFSYLGGYAFEVSASRVIAGAPSSREGDEQEIAVTVRERGSATTPLGERLRVEWAR